jgi:dihydroorotate dehydrogenase electron transfer subunit
MGHVGCVMDRETVPVLFNERVRPAMWRLGLRYDALRRGARAAKFVMLGFPRRSDPLLPRPFSLSDAYVDAGGPVVEILYKPAGRATGLMTSLRPGDDVSLLGLLGNGFPTPAPGLRPVLLAGGIGNAPFAYQVRELVAGPFAADPSRVVLFLAGRHKDEIYVQDFVRRSGVTIVEATDDGSLGDRGFVTDALDRRLAALGPVEAFACGPTPMLRAVKKLAAARGFRAWLSVEEAMACGYGVCNACVVPRADDPAQYVKACQDGPVFDAAEIVP